MYVFVFPLIILYICPPGLVYSFPTFKVLWLVFKDHRHQVMKVSHIKGKVQVYAYLMTKYKFYRYLCFFIILNSLLMIY